MYSNSKFISLSGNNTFIALFLCKQVFSRNHSYPSKYFYFSYSSNNNLSRNSDRIPNQGRPTGNQAVHNPIDLKATRSNCLYSMKLPPFFPFFSFLLYPFIFASASQTEKPIALYHGYASMIIRLLPNRIFDDLLIGRLD